MKAAWVLCEPRGPKGLVGLGSNPPEVTLGGSGRIVHDAQLRPRGKTRAV